MTDNLLVGVVDSGYAAEQAPYVKAARRFWLEHDQLAEGSTKPDVLAHGTAVIDALISGSEPVKLCVGQVFDRRGVTSALQVAGAISWLARQGVSVITLSLGLRNDRPALREACMDAVNAGILLCASSPAQGEPVYPAAYPNVLRITGDARCSAGQWSWLNTIQADFGAPVRSAAGAAGASIACANLVSQITSFLRATPEADRSQVVAYLREGAAYIGPERKGRRRD